MKRYFQLAALIVRRGTLRPRGQNFNSARAGGLEKLRTFLPAGTDLRKTVKPQNFFRYLAGQVAFIRSSFPHRGGHLRSSGVAYVRIPKSANTSVSYALLVKKYPELRAANPDERQINFLTDLHIEPAAAAGSERLFTVVRNPFARIVSVYRDFFENRQPDFLYAGYLFGVLTPGISFAEFVSRIIRIPDRLKDQHFRPQHLFIRPYRRAGKTVECFTLENPASLENFLHKHGLEFVHKNKSSAPYRYQDYYTPELVEQVYALYRKDVDTFGYQHDYMNLKAAAAGAQNP